MMKKIFVLISVMTMFLTTSVQAQTARYDIVPLPRNIALQQAPGFVLSEKTAIVYADGLAREAQFLKEYVEEMTQLQLSVRPYAKNGDAKGNIVLSIAAPAKKKPLVEPNEEAYTLTVSAKGVQLSGQTTAAVFRGIQTLRKSLPV
ncbi:MAG: glycoside hydrolase family 20 zincin-like fold domain-containing protein, partial [Prevotella sp.]|nr:glycoside hydrolase family 20 zincin-like fold domain-containing protein [Prevotella sp.]